MDTLDQTDVMASERVCDGKLWLGTEDLAESDTGSIKNIMPGTAGHLHRMRARHEKQPEQARQSMNHQLRIENLTGINRV